jgi:hypothetical protein
MPTTNTRTTIDLAPLVELVPQTTAMRNRLAAGEDVKAQLFALAEIDDSHLSIEDGVDALLDEICGIAALNVAWDQRQP